MSVTTVSARKLAAHVAPQSIPGGSLVTVPLPVPALLTDKAWNTGSSVKVAVTDCAALIVTTHAPVPLQCAAPPREARSRPPRVAVSVTTVSAR